MWKNNQLTDGQRNVRILFVTLVLYVIVYAISNEYKDKNIFMRIINTYFFYFLAIDIITSACLYRTYYGRSVLNELHHHETDKYDENTHSYHKDDKNIINISETPANNTISNDIKSNA
jgi:hypothetical protein